MARKHAVTVSSQSADAYVTFSEGARVSDRVSLDELVRALLRIASMEPGDPDAVALARLTVGAPVYDRPTP